MAKKTDAVQPDDDHMAYLRARAESLFGPFDARIRRNALVSKDHDNLRFEFIGMLTAEFQHELKGLPLAVSSGHGRRDPVWLALEWFADHGLFAPWLREWLEGAPESWWQTTGSPVRIWGPIGGPFEKGMTRETHLARARHILGEELLAKHDAEVRGKLDQLVADDEPPPVGQLPAPRPWQETEAAFIARCQDAWDQQVRWMKRRGFVAPRENRRKKGARTDSKPDYLRALLRHALRDETWPKLAADLLNDPKSLRREVNKLKKRLALGGRRDLERYADGGP